MIYLSDVAREAGVSVATASRSLNNHPAISDATKERVEAAAQKLGYNRRKSRSEKKNTDKTVGVIVPDLRTHHHKCMVEALMQQFRRKKHTVIVMSTDFVRNEALHGVKLLSAMGVNLLLLIQDGSQTALKPLIAAVNARGIPVMWISFNRISAPEFDSICLDEQKEGAMAIEHLRGRGYRRIAFIGDQNSTSLRDAFLHAMQSLKMKVNPDFVRIGPERLEKGGYLRMKEILEMRELPDAVCCSCGQMAVGAAGAIQEAGLRIVSDIAVLSMSDCEMLEYIAGGVSAIAVPYDEMAAVAVRTLLNRQELSGGGVQQFEAKPALKVRSTT